MASLTLGLISIWVFFCVSMCSRFSTLSTTSLSLDYTYEVNDAVCTISIVYVVCVFFCQVVFGRVLYDSIVSDPYTIWLTPPLFIFTAAILSLKICLLYYIIERLFRVSGHREENMDAAEIPWIPRHCTNPRPIQFSIQFFFLLGWGYRGKNFIW
jgi:hypothetical protein